jgi:diguanylate cyclase (GGDEF)-like protein/PAS domain S-box-containing protein
VTKIGSPEDRTPTVEHILTLQRDAIAGLIRSSALGAGDVEAALVLITEAAARLLGVQRASVWRFDEPRTSIECLDLYEAKLDRHERGAKIEHDSAPAYFAAAKEERCIAANDARTDPRTKDFRDGYLEPFGITSMLDVPVIVRGQLIGVVCHEHVGEARTWSAREELLAATLADYVGMTLSSSEHAAQARELATLKEDLERRVETRTKELKRSRENVRTLFETSPVALTLTSLGDGSIVLANRSAAALFGVALEEVIGRKSLEFYCDPDDRARLMEMIRVDGRIDRAELLMKNDRDDPFWAELSATVIEFDEELAILAAIHDITDMKRAERSLRRSEEMMRTMLAASPVPLVVTGTSEGLVLFSNERAAELFGTTLDGFVGRPLSPYFVEESDLVSLLDQVRSQDAVDGFAVRMQTVDKKTFWALVGARPAILDGQSVVILGITDLTTQKEVEQRLRELATLDSLTGIYNRRHFFEVADATLSVADRHGNQACVAMLDIDHFKAVNDVHGHLVGDELLRRVTRATRDVLRGTDVLARYGGEEFVLLLPDIDLDAATRIVERIRVSVGSEVLETEGRSVAVTLSVGLVSRSPRESLETLLARADEALYQAKNAGRNRVVIG